VGVIVAPTGKKIKVKIYYCASPDS